MLLIAGDLCRGRRKIHTSHYYCCCCWFRFMSIKHSKNKSTMKISDVVNDYWAEVRMFSTVHVCVRSSHTLSFLLRDYSSSSIFIFALLVASMWQSTAIGIFQCYCCEKISMIMCFCWSIGIAKAHQVQNRKREWAQNKILNFYFVRWIHRRLFESFRAIQDTSQFNAVRSRKKINENCWTKTLKSIREFVWEKSTTKTNKKKLERKLDYE